MPNATGEMPFLDHLEELRKRILLSLVAIVIGFAVGWWLTTHYHLIQVVEAPVAPLVAGGKLTTLSLTDPFMIVMKFAFILGVVLASPFVIYQLWLFLSPALTSREKRAIVPSIGIGFILFAAGAALGWFYVVAPAVDWLFNFQAGTFSVIPTYDSYMTLVLHLLVGMGISAELPLIMILLASLGVMSYRVYSRFRRYAVLASFVGGAILAPTPEVTMMILFTIPLLLLYEVGVAGAWLVERRRARVARIAAGLMLLAFCLAPRGLHGQVPQPPPAQRPPGAVDTVRKVSGQNLQRVDSGALKRLGLPAGPLRTFAAPDSIMQALLAREGFAATRYTADSVRFVVDGQQIRLGGRAATLRDGAQLEADQIVYDGQQCGRITADGEPRMFEKGQQPLIGRTMTFSTCADSSRGVIGEAFTALAERGANWFMRGHLAVDSGGKRLYGARTEFTSCDLPDPHYHFVAGRVKWVSQSIIVARPAVLYVRDVPVFWLPFIFQDTKRDRSSGILIPRFGFNDIVRTNRNYNRQVTNVGYYWAPNDYIDATASLDWYANRYTQVNGTLNYRWLDRFVTGSLTLQRQIQSGGGSSNVLSWNHDQRFDVTTTIHFNLNYQSNSTIQLNNAIDPLASTRQITSNLNLTKRYAWGTVTLGGTRSQALGGGAGSMSFPSLTIQPGAFLLGSHITLSPSFSVSNVTQFNTPLAGLPPVLSFGGIDSSSTPSTSSSRTTSITLSLPTDFFGFTLSNSFQYQDQVLVGRKAVTELVPNPATAGRDSVTKTTIRGGDYSSGLDWNTGFNLPLILRGTWKITPSVGVTNVTGGPYLLRSAASNGVWVAQGKKLQFGLSASPTFFGFTKGGAGPYQLFRYTFAPSMSLRWSPASSVSLAYARAEGSIGGSGLADVPATTLATITFHQVFEGKLKPGAKDTNSDPSHLPKKNLLSISTSSISYDFEQAKLPGHSGWTMGVISNSFQSDLIPGLNVSTTHDLFQGNYTSDTARFSPFLSNANASFSLTGRTFRPIARLLGLVRKDSMPSATPAAAPSSSSPLALAPSQSQFRPGAGGMPAGLPRTGFSASLNFSYSRQRPVGTTGLPVSTEPGTIGAPVDPFGTGTLLPIPVPPAQSQVGITTSFSPTQFWTVSWTTNYDITRGAFQSHQIHLQRDLHDWRASFDFTKGPNGNFALYFSMFLVNLPDIKFDYNQTTLQQAPIQP
jgi:Tat protein translocase TatC